MIMEELIQKIDELINAINNNSVPLWLTIIGILVPIAISLLVWWQSHQQNKKNIALQQQIKTSEEKLQKEISSKEIKVQMHGDILMIYDDFCLAQNTIGYAEDNVHTIFSNFNSNNGISLPLQWINNVTSSTNMLCQSINKAKLLLPSEDTEIRTILESIWEKYKELRKKAYEYFYSGTAFTYSNNAWNIVGPRFNIIAGDYNTLVSNPIAYDAFLKLCINDTTKEINEKIKEILDLLTYNKFDIFFEKYLRMDAE